MLTIKTILAGNFGVGKSSLFKRFIHNEFDERYLTTIGVKVDKKILEVDGKSVKILLWDLAGEVTQDKVPHNYFLGASALIYVVDLSRPGSFEENIFQDVLYLKEKTNLQSIFIVGNKTDLLEYQDITDICNRSSVPVFLK